MKSYFYLPLNPALFLSQQDSSSALNTVSTVFKGMNSSKSQGNK